MSGLSEPSRTDAAANTKLMLEVFDGLNAEVNAWRLTLTELRGRPGANLAELDCFGDGLFCYQLALTYFTEANRALQAGAWFAATAIGSSALEAVLMSLCFLRHEKVRELPKFKTLKKSLREDFGSFVRQLDLGKLLDIATQLSWFPDGGVPKLFEEMMSPHIGAASMTAMKELFAAEGNVGQVCAKHVRDYRNLLHPAVCLKESRQPSSEAGKTGVFLFLIAFLSVANINGIDNYSK
jgi:hypothetical protein